MFSSRIGSLVSLAAMLMCIACVAPKKGLRNVEIGSPVPAFTVRGLDGTEIDNKAYHGRVLVVVFARPDHEKSLEALRAAEHILEANPNSKLSVLAVATKQGTEEQFRRIAAESGLAFPIAMDAERKMYGEFGVFVAPTTLLIDGTGILRFVIPHTPISHDRRLRLHTDLLLGKTSREEHDRELSQTDESKVEGQDAWTRRLGLAQTMIDDGKFDQAIPILTELHAERESVASATLLGTALLEVDRVSEAGKYLDPLAGRKLKSPKVKLALARLELKRGNDDAAARHLKDALKTSPVKGPILFRLGRLHERRGELAEAVECYREALQELYGDS